MLVYVRNGRIVKWEDGKVSWRKCDLFQAFLGAFPVYLGERATGSDGSVAHFLRNSQFFRINDTRHYDEAQLRHLVEQLAHQATPFPLQAGGLALFTGSHPVLYVPIVRTIELSHFHQRVWQAISSVGEGIPPYYEPNSWMPHITLAEQDIQAESLARIMARFFTRELLWEIPIDNLAIIWDTGTQQELRYQFHFSLSGQTE
jgi:2'-5' RNA ligase